MAKGIGGHQRAYRGHSDEWLTPPAIIDALGPFDLDPCSPVHRPWDTAKLHYTIEDDGLAKPWGDNRVFMNPPYGPETGKWLEKLANHGNGIALIFARTETEIFHRWVWQRADAILFLRGRLYFHKISGERGRSNAGGPSALIAYNPANADKLRTCGIAGHFVDLQGRMSKSSNSNASGFLS